MIGTHDPTLPQCMEVLHVQHSHGLRCMLADHKGIGFLCIVPEQHEAPHCSRCCRGTCAGQQLPGEQRKPPDSLAELSPIKDADGGLDERERLCKLCFSAMQADWHVSVPGVIGDPIVLHAQGDESGRAAATFSDGTLHAVGMHWLSARASLFIWQDRVRTPDASSCAVCSLRAAGLR